MSDRTGRRPGIPASAVLLSAALNYLRARLKDHSTIVSRQTSTCLILITAIGLTAGTPGIQAQKAPSSPQKKNEMPEQTNTPKHTNRLAQEKSPYLLQHQHNPVDWHPWGEEAFETAKREDKPILLSIGYSTCHWCHVMERESFEDEETAAFMNAHFVCIKLDREERPDIDKIYMTFVQAMTGAGGWPLNVFLTPDLKPFYGGTYFPPDGRYGRPSWMQILKQIANVWDTRKEEVLSSSDKLYERMQQAVQQEANDDASLSGKVLDNAAEQFKKEYDPKHGGFGRAPKFPRPAQPIFLLRHAVRTKDQEAVDMVLFTCEKMAAGGMYDQLGGGFARYSVDDKWLVPHFEKMLYDNAQLIQLYLDAYLVGDRPRFAEVVRDVIRYVLRDMTHPEGGFYSAEDADSEGKEGKFYTWTLVELEELLTPGEFEVAKRYYGLTAEGNFEDHSDPDPLKNQNVLSVVNPDLNSEQRKMLESAREKMFQAREKRVRPGLDDKVLASWNGMMLGAIARAYAVLGEEQYLEAARKNLRFLKDKLWDADSGTLYHRWREGERDTAQLLDDYANLLSGVLELYQASLEAEHLEFAIQLADSMIERFYDRDHGGFWQSGEESKHLIIRVKEDYDGAEPSGNSVAVLALLKLAAITDQARYKQAAEKSAKLFADRARDLPQAVPYLLSGIDFLIHEPHRAVLVAEQPDALKPLILASHQVYQPNKVVLSNQGPVENLAKEMPVENEPLAYICTGTACQPPTGDADQLKKLLQ